MNDTTNIDVHLKSFAEAFVLPQRKEKWITLLSQRPENIISEASKLFNYLDHNYIEQNDQLKNVVSHQSTGVYYDFKHQPKCVSLKDALEEEKDNDAIFSIEPGTLVIYFNHEGWNFVCKN